MFIRYSKTCLNGIHVYLLNADSRWENIIGFAFLLLNYYFFLQWVKKTTISWWTVIEINCINSDGEIFIVSIITIYFKIIVNY